MATPHPDDALPWDDPAPPAALVQPEPDHLPWEPPPVAIRPPVSECTDPTLPDWAAPEDPFGTAPAAPIQTPDTAGGYKVASFQATHPEHSTHDPRQEHEQAALLREVSELVGQDPDEVLRALRDHVEARHAASIAISGLKAKMASLERRYGKVGGGMNQSHYEHERSQLLAEISEDVRIRYAREPETRVDSKGKETVVALTDGRAADMARADPRYKRALDLASEERLEYARLAAELSGHFAEKEYRDGMIVLCTETLDTIRAMLYHNRSERQRTT